MEDVLCAGHTHGISTIIVPGAGEANFDTYENNPFENTRQRQEMEVQSLMNKLTPEMIGLGDNYERVFIICVPFNFFFRCFLKSF